MSITKTTCPASCSKAISPGLRLASRVKLFKSYRDDYPDGGQQRDFVYVKDCLDIMAWLIENRVGGLFNVGTGQALSWNDSAACRVPRHGLPAADRVHRNARRAARPLPILHAGRHDPAAGGPAAPRAPFTTLEDAVHDFYVERLSGSQHAISRKLTNRARRAMAILDHDYPVFVYGSLKRGQPNHRILIGAEFPGTGLDRAVVCPVLLAGPYPAMVRESIRSPSRSKANSTAPPPNCYWNSIGSESDWRPVRAPSCCQSAASTAAHHAWRAWAYLYLRPLSVALPLADAARGPLGNNSATRSNVSSE